MLHGRLHGRLIRTAGLPHGLYGAQAGERRVLPHRAPHGALRDAEALRRGPVARSRGEELPKRGEVGDDPPPAELLALRSRSPKAGVRPLYDPRALDLGEHADQRVHRAANRARQVEGFPERCEPDAEVL